MDTTAYGPDGTRLEEIEQEVRKEVSDTLKSVGIPESVTRAQVIAACEALGLDPQKVGYLEMSRSTKAIVVELFDVGTRFQRGLIESGQLRPVTAVEIEVVE